MSLFNNNVFPDITNNPLKKSLFIETWDDDAMIPPPGSSYIVTEDMIIIATEAGDEFITE